MSEQNTSEHMGNGLLAPNSNQLEPDTSERLEADVKACADGAEPGHGCTDLRKLTVCVDTVLSWLDRQAAITTAECTATDELCCEACRAAQKRRVDELTAERRLIARYTEWRDDDDVSLAEHVAAMASVCDSLKDIIAERDELRDECESYRDNMLAQNKRVAELTAELDACRMRERAAEDYDFREAAQRWARAFEDKCGEVVRLTAERDDLQAAIDAMGNGQFYAMYKAKCEECEEAVSFAKRVENAVNGGQPVTLFGVDYEKPNKKLLAEHERLLKKLKRLRRRLSKLRKERDYLQKVVKTQAESFKKLECELAGKQ